MKEVGTISKYNVETYIRLSRDENYIGTLVQGKRKNENYISHREVKNPEKDWIKFENHHEELDKMIYIIKLLSY